MEDKDVVKKIMKKSISLEGFISMILFITFFFLMGRQMGTSNMFNTIMNTSHKLLLNTVFFIMGIAVIAGAVAALLSEFGVISIIKDRKSVV